MSTPTLDETDRDILERLTTSPRDVGDLAVDLEHSEIDLDERLTALEESGLVSETGTAYELTDSGRRLLDAPGDTSADDRIDVPDDVARGIEALDLPPDREAALRSAVAFLGYWGEATGYEIADGVYSERPAGYETAQEWWTEFVRERLAALPGVESSDDGTRWRYERKGDDPVADGRIVSSDDAPPYASVKHALRSIDLSEDEREAVHAVFAVLFEHREATRAEIAETVHDARPAGRGTVTEWWAWMDDVLAELPGITRDGDTWRYETRVDDPHSPGGGSHVSRTESDVDRP